MLYEFSFFSFFKYVKLILLIKIIIKQVINDSLKYLEKVQINLFDYMRKFHISRVTFRRQNGICPFFLISLHDFGLDRYFGSPKLVSSILTLVKQTNDDDHDYYNKKK